MPMFDDKHVKIQGCYVVWDGVTRPDQTQDGKPKYSLKVVVDPNNPDLGLYNNLSQQALQQSKFAGVLPQGGRMPIGTAQANEFNGLYTGWAVLNCNSLRLPDVYDENGQQLDPMQYAPFLYGGQQVDVLVHCYEYDAKGNKGIATGLDGFAIIASANAPRQNFGGSGIDTSGAFGGGGGAAQQPQQYAQQPVQQPAQQPQQYAQQPVQQPQQYAQQPVQQPQQYAQPPVQQPAQQPQPVQQPAQQPQPVQQPAQQPQQAHNFLPQQ